MSLLLVFQELEQGRLKLGDIVTVSEHAASMGGSQVFLEPGKKPQGNGKQFRPCDKNNVQ